ncbi:hypothetical protein BMS3Bbin02_01039 [bacterium BMS3Bbin02]|nr:hypothetical protein BMS3Bbin02_01039 [bacterium BMS3Bbin02]
MRLTIVSGRPGASPAVRARIDPESRRLRCIDKVCRRPEPHPGLRSRRSGRASVTTRIGCCVVRSTSSSTKSSNPASAQCKSSNTMSTVPRWAILWKKVRRAENNSERSPAGIEAIPIKAASLDSIQVRSSSSGTNSATTVRNFMRLFIGSSPSEMPARRRTISPRAQNVTPSPYAGDRPLW